MGSCQDRELVEAMEADRGPDEHGNVDGDGNGESSGDGHRDGCAMKATPEENCVEGGRDLGGSDRFAGLSDLHTNAGPKLYVCP